MSNQNSVLSSPWENDSRSGNRNFPLKSPAQALARVQYGQAIFIPANIGTPAHLISTVIPIDHAVGV